LIVAGTTREIDHMHVGSDAADGGKMKGFRSGFLLGCLFAGGLLMGAVRVGNWVCVQRSPHPDSPAYVVRKLSPIADENVILVYGYIDNADVAHHLIETFTTRV
jgi:hypothetical protein